ncbi:MAG: hypothetical protein ACR2P0_07310, partial [Acidimicrobiales bacterium]
MIEDPAAAADEPSGELPVAFRQGNTFEGVLPILAYFAGDQLGTRALSETAGNRIAIVAMTLASGFAIVQRHRREQAIGWWIPSVAGYLFIRGIAGLIWGEDVFLAFGIGLKVALGLTALVSVMIGRAIVGELAPLVLPFSEEVRQHRSYRST